MKKLITTLCTTAAIILLTTAAVWAETGESMSKQIAELKSAVKGKRVGLLLNPTAVDTEFNHIVDILLADGQTTIVALFGPEHGVRGNEQAGAKVADTIDEDTSIPVFTLYGTRTAPTAEQMKMLDVLVLNIQDSGARFYTRTWIMTHAMEACAKYNKEFIVFDRPNPAGADRVEGAPLKFDAGLIGRYWANTPMSVTTAHGLTAGELATLVNEEFLEPKAKLQVIRMPAYKRNMSFEETGYPWVAPSPNMPTTETTLVYLGTCIFEGTNLSEGRGTTKPFELSGAPWVNATQLAKHLNAKQLPGVRFRAASFTPTFSKYNGELCHGVQIHVTDRATFNSVATGYHMLKAYLELYPDKINDGGRDWCGSLMGQKNLYNRLKDEPVEKLLAEFEADRQEYLKLRDKYLFYK